MDFKVSSDISIGGDAEQTAEPYLEQQGCRFLGTCIHCGIPI